MARGARPDQPDVGAGRRADVGGAISIRWQHIDGEFTLTVTSPRPTSVSVPLQSTECTITRDGKVVWQNSPIPGVDAHRNGDRVAFTGEAGRHTLG